MLKRKLAGTALGSALSYFRDRVGLVGGAVTNSLDIGDRRNNMIAGYLVTRLRRPGRTFVDVGAHIGSVLGEVLRHSPGPVIAFEAIPTKAAHLARKFPGVTIHNVALLDKTGETSFFIDNAQSGYSSLAGGAGDVTEIRVPLARMDDLIPDADVDVIKIDVEGAELGVLRGAEALVKRCRPVIMFESGPTPVMGYGADDLWRWFDAQDYHVYLPDRITRAARAATLEVFVDSHEYPFRAMNYFGIPRERMAEISARAQQILRDIP